VRPVALHDCQRGDVLIANWFLVRLNCCSARESSARIRVAHRRRPSLLLPVALTAGTLHGYAYGELNRPRDER
jgi:hypothetical protein